MRIFIYLDQSSLTASATLVSGLTASATLVSGLTASATLAVDKSPEQSKYRKFIVKEGTFKIKGGGIFYVNK